MKKRGIGLLLIVGLAVISSGQPQLLHARQKESPSSNSLPQLIVQLGHSVQVNSVAFSHDNRFVLTGGDETTCLWEAATGREIRRFAGHTEQVNAVAFSPDGRLVLTGSGHSGLDNTARLWEAATGKEVRRFSGHTNQVMAVAFSPDGRSVVTGGMDDTARVWDVATGQEALKMNWYMVTSVAFSPDGRLIAAGSRGKIASLWDATTGKEARRLEGHSGGVNCVIFSPDGRYVATGSDDKTGRLWNAATGQEVRRFEGMSDSVKTLAFFPDSRLILTGGKEACIWEVETGKQIKRFDNRFLASAAVSPDSHFIVTGGYSNAASLWDAGAQNEVRRFEGVASEARAVAFSKDGGLLLVNNSLWDVAKGRELQRFEGMLADTVYSSALSPDGRSVLTVRSYEAHLWDAASGDSLKEFAGEGAVAFSPDGRYFLTGGKDKVARLWNRATLRETGRLVGHSGLLLSAAFSPDSRFVATGGWDSTARLWNVATAKEERRFQMPVAIRKIEGPTGSLTIRDGDIHVGSVAFSPDGRYILTGSWDLHGINKTARLWEVATGRLAREFDGHSRAVNSAAFSPDGRLVVTGSQDNTARILDAASGKELRRLQGHMGAVHSAVFSIDGRQVVTAGGDGAAHFWDAATGQEICRLVSLPEKSFAAVTPDGRFDTNNLEGAEGLYWSVVDDPFRPLPIEIFMRDYYEPRLLPRLLAGEKLREVRNLSQLNRVQPVIEEIKIEPQADAPGRVTVKVKVSGATGAATRNGQPMKLHYGVYDLRLFREGQLVGYAPQTGGDTAQGEVKLDEAGKAILSFPNIRLPSHLEDRIEFTAYAFNADRVKSATGRQTYEVSSSVPSEGRKAYIIGLGVNVNENPDWNLRFAVNDMRRLQSTLMARLSALIDDASLDEKKVFGDVIPVPLISDGLTRGGRAVAERTATKANFRTVLDLLVGKEVSQQLRASIPNAERIRMATPEDLVIITFASHGYADSQGNFYLVPFDTGAARGSRLADALGRCISSNELALWLRDVDAGEIVMIVDACYSATAVQGEGFKPGPMGSRGLGQLSYDKGMRILAATQADNVALELEGLGHGLLTYALVRDGIESLHADYKPKNGVITMEEWLNYSVERVPKLYEDVRAGRRTLLVNGRTSKLAGEQVRQSSSIQRPSLFDFAKKRDEMALVKGR